MFEGFKKFLMRGNVIDLAVAVVIGTAVTAVVTSLTDKVIQPLINSIGGANPEGWGFQVIEDNPSTFVDFGAVVGALINFFLIAVIVYFIIVVPMNKAQEAYKKRNGIDSADAEATETELLVEIRDLLKEQASDSQ